MPSTPKSLAGGRESTAIKFNAANNPTRQITIMTTLFIATADLHINSTVAICPPTINLDDGGTYHSTPAQHWLWECWLETWRKIGEMQADRVVLLLNGDIGELDTKRRSNQLITLNKATIQEIVTDTLKPALDVAKEVYVVRGTQAHVGKSSWLEEAIAQDIIGAKHDDSRGTASWWHIQGKIENVRVDIAHHAGMGGAPWSRANGANNLAARVMWQYRVDLDIPAPQLVIRSHNHKYASSGDNYPARVYYTPCWTLITEYGYKIGRENDHPDIGLLVFEIDGDQVEMHRVIYRPKQDRKVWSVRL